MKKIMFYLVFSIALYSCDPCKDYLCFSPPPEFIFQFVDSVNGQDLFYNNTFDTINFTATDAKAIKQNFQFFHADSSVLIIFPNIGWNIGQQEYKLHLDSLMNIEITIQMDHVNEHCCSFFQTHSFSVKNHTWQIEQNGIIKIKI